MNHKNKQRFLILKSLLNDYKLNIVDLGHSTYHHFIGNRLFDSQIDVLLYSVEDLIGEELVNIICKKEFPMVLSHHDMVISRFTIFKNPFIISQEFRM